MPQHSVEAEDLVAELKRRQDETRQSGKAFAAQLGVSQPLWSRVRRGKQKVTAYLVLHALLRYPELRPLIETK